MVVVSILIALISLLCIILAFVTIPPVMHMIRRKMPIPQARIDRRYATIDGWLITKVWTMELSIVNSHVSASSPLHPRLIIIVESATTRCRL